MTEFADTDERRRDRSPSFPFISLSKSIDRARAMADAHKRNPARLPAVGETWGYGAKSSGLLQTASALKAFGLIEDIGRGEDRKIQLTELAWRILHDSRPGAKEQAVKEAAHRPRLIAEYMAQWLPDRPSDSHCISELHLDRGFTPVAAQSFLRVFDETVAFANLNSYDNLSSAQAEEVEVESVRENTKPAQKVMPAFADFSAKAAPRTSPRATLPLPEGEAAIEIPRPLTKESYSALKAWVDVMLMLAERSAVDDAPKADEAAN